MTNEAPERIWFTKVDGNIVPNSERRTDADVEYLRSDLARPKVKPLEWEDHPSDNKPALAKAVTSFGTYFICDDTDDFSGVYLQFVSHDRAKWWQHVRSTCETIIENYHDDGLEPLKAAAQADYERRILSALEGQDHDRTK